MTQLNAHPLTHARPWSAAATFTRRVLFGALAMLACAGTAWSQDDTITVTILGSGTPDPRPDRFGQSTLVEAGGKTLVFDAGRGASIRLQQLNVSIGQLTAVFLTHYHSDHTNGLPDLWLTGWLPPHGARKTPFRVIGPTGVKALMAGLTAAYKADIDIRIEDELLPAAGIEVRAQEFSAEGVVFDEGGVRVTAIKVDHGARIEPAYGYRVSYGKRSVVISGDTRYSENLIRQSQGVDLLLHEVADAPDDLKKIPAIQRILDHHTLPEAAGRVFAQSRPRLAAFTHLVLLKNAQGQRPSDADVAKATRSTYDGPLELGVDLMRFTLGDSVVVQRYDFVKGSY